MHFLVCDDDPSDAQVLSELLRQQIHGCRVSVVHSGDEVIPFTKKNTLNALFLDIELADDIGGIEFAAELRKTYQNIPIVFYTSHIHYCEEIFTVSPAALLLKPATSERVRRVMHILQNNETSGGCLTISNTKTALRQIPLDQIAYIENIHRHLTVFGTDGRVLAEFCGKKLTEIGAQLGKGFLLCHQSIIVNMSEISSVRRYVLTLRCGIELPISQRRFGTVRKCWGEYLGETL